MGKDQEEKNDKAIPSEIRRDGLRMNGLDQVREILFGTTQRDLEARLARSGLQASARLSELEHEHRRRIDMLEAHLKKEAEALGSRSERHFVETDEALRTATREQRDLTAQLERRIAKAEEASANGLRELRENLLAQQKSFLDELQGMRKEVLATIERELGMGFAASEERGEAEPDIRH